MLYYRISVKTYKVQLLPDFVALVIWNFGGVVDIFNRHFADRFWRKSEWNKAAQNRSKYVAKRNPCRNGWGGKVITKCAAFILIGREENEVRFWLVKKILPSFFQFFLSPATPAFIWLSPPQRVQQGINLRHFTSILTLFAPVLHCKSHRSTIQSYTEM